MKVAYTIEIEDGPNWLSHVEIERRDDRIVFTAVRRSDSVLATFSLSLDDIARITKDQ